MPSAERCARLPGTKSAAQPFFSPDGRSLGFFAEGSLESSISQADAASPSRTAAGCFRRARGPETRRVVILFSRGVSAGLWRIGGAGGSIAPVTSLDSVAASSHLWPHFLPDGRHFLFVVAAGREPGIYLGSLDHGAIRCLIETPHIAGTAVAYSPSGHLLYLRGGTLVAQPFDVTRLELTSDAVRVAESVACYGPGVSSFSVSAEGTLVFREDAGWPEWQPVWLDRAARIRSDQLVRYWSGTPLFPPSRAPDVFRPSISSDGRWLALTRRQSNRHPQIWISTFSVARHRRLPSAHSMGCRSGRRRVIGCCGEGPLTRILTCTCDQSPSPVEGSC